MARYSLDCFSMRGRPSTYGTGVLVDECGSAERGVHGKPERGQNGGFERLSPSGPPDETVPVFGWFGATLDDPIIEVYEPDLSYPRAGVERQHHIAVIGDGGVCDLDQKQHVSARSGCGSSCSFSLTGLCTS